MGSKDVQPALEEDYGVEMKTEHEISRRDWKFDNGMDVDPSSDHDVSPKLSNIKRSASSTSCLSSSSDSSRQESTASSSDVDFSSSGISCTFSFKAIRPRRAAYMSCDVTESDESESSDADEDSIILADDQANEVLLISGSDVTTF